MDMMGRGYDGAWADASNLLSEDFSPFLPPRPHPEAAHRQLLNKLGGLGI